MVHRTGYIAYKYILFSKIFAMREEGGVYMEYIFPDPDEKICIVRKKDSNGNIPDVERLPKTSELYKKVTAELEFPFHQSIIKLSQCTRNLMA